MNKRWLTSIMSYIVILMCFQTIYSINYGITIELKITRTIPSTGNVKPCPGMPTVVMPSLRVTEKRGFLNFQNLVKKCTKTSFKTT
jgi:hypothetical protein